VPFVPILIALLAVGVIVLAAVGLRVRGSLRRFALVRGSLDSYLTDRSGLLRARSAALGVALSEVGKLPDFGRRSVTTAPRTINGSVEREDHRA
jgi:hypothetical protein